MLKCFICYIRVSTTTTVSENYDKVPFSLKPRDSSGASVLVTDARSADFIDSAMHTTYDEFRPTVRTVAGICILYLALPSTK